MDNKICSEVFVVKFIFSTSSSFVTLRESFVKINKPVMELSSFCGVNFEKYNNSTLFQIQRKSYGKMFHATLQNLKPPGHWT